MQTVNVTGTRRGQTFRRLTTSLLVFVLVCSMTGTPAAFGQGGWSGAEAETVIDLAFDEASLPKVFQSLADAAGLNVLVDPSVSGTVSFKLRDIPVKEAIELVARVTGFDYEIVGSTLIVASRERLQQQLQTTDLEIIPVNHVSPAEAADMVGRLYPRVNVIADSAKNMLIVQGSGAEVAAVRSFLSQYDQGHDDPLQFRNESVESILWALADRAGWNLIVDGSLTGEMSARLEGMDYGDALALVSEAANLEHRFSGRVLYVSQTPPPAEPVPTRQVAIHRLDHVDPVKTGEVLVNLYPDIHVNVDESARTIVIEGEDRMLETVAAFVGELDVARRQVIVEARLEEIDVNALQRLGVDWGDQRGVVAPVEMNPLVLAWDPVQLRARLEALNEEGLSTVLASPKLAAIDGEAATIMIGDRIPILLQSEDEEGRVTETLEFIEAGIKLEILATISSDDAVTLNIDTEVSSIAAMTAQDIPQIRTREMNTRVRVRDGQSLVIGGLIEESERERMNSMPLLGDLPLLGRLFSTRTKESVQTEMVIFLIPHIVHDTPVASGVHGAARSPATDEGGATAEHPGLRSVGTVVPGPMRNPSGAVGEVDEGRREGDASEQSSGKPAPLLENENSVAWLDVTSQMVGAYDFQFERRKDDKGFLTGLYVAPGSAGTAYGGNVAVRRYGADISGITPWAGLGIEYLAAPGGDAGYNLAARIGIGTREAAPLRIELYGEYSISDGAISWPNNDVPARQDGLRTGVRFGWEY